jgi:hypothetical protein
MGWWTQNEEGHSFALVEAKEMVWGDGPADILGEAVCLIDKEFKRDWGRRATLGELIAGLKFSAAERDV